MTSKSISKEYVSRRFGTRRLYINALQTWKLSPPQSGAHYRTYDPSLYNASAGRGILGYTNYNPPSIDAFVESLPSIGIPIASDLNSGNNIGGKHELSTLNPESQTRISSYLAFWNTVVDRPNFEGITFATVEKILFRNPSGRESSQQPVAYGAEYSAVVNGSKCRQTVYADKEVILSAGTLQTPQVLMLSVRRSLTSKHVLTFPCIFVGYWTTPNIGGFPNPSFV